MTSLTSAVGATLFVAGLAWCGEAEARCYYLADNPQVTAHTQAAAEMLFPTAFGSPDKQAIRVRREALGDLSLMTFVHRWEEWPFPIGVAIVLPREDCAAGLEAIRDYVQRMSVFVASEPARTELATMRSNARAVSEQEFSAQTMPGPPPIIVNVDPPPPP